MAVAPSPSSAPQGDEPDPSMDDILASIRRILNEDEKAARPLADGVLMLDPSMIVEDGERPAAEAPSGAAPAATGTAPAPASASASASASAGHDDMHLEVEEPLALATMDDFPRNGSGSPEPAFPPPTVPREAPAPESPLVAPAAAAAAAHSVGSLVRTLAAERSALVTRGGLTIEDLVREEVRPVLKEWLDAHLPPLVERMVRAELERVVGRTV